MFTKMKIHPNKNIVATFYLYSRDATLSTTPFNKCEYYNHKSVIESNMIVFVLEL